MEVVALVAFVVLVVKLLRGFGRMRRVYARHKPKQSSVS
jgi:hypothetical protein